MSDMYLEPPHLSIAVYSDQSEIVTLSQMCDVVRELECVPTNLVEVAPLDRDFELLSDLSDVTKTLTPNPDRYDQLIAGRDPLLRVLRVGFKHKKFGEVIVEYQQKIGVDRHPLAISLAASSLGLPESTWSAGQRRSAFAIAAWTRDALKITTLRCPVFYGIIGVEISLPTPSKIEKGKSRLATELFVSRQLLDQNGSLEAQLREIYSNGDAVGWESGIFFSGWAPFNSRRITLKDPSKLFDFRLTS